MPIAPHVVEYADLIREAGLAEQRGDPALAEGLLRQALAHRPDDAHARFLLGTLYARHGATAHAVTELECAARLRPYHVDTHYNLAIALRSAGRLDDAVSSYQRAIELHPRMAEAHNNLGNLHKELGRLAEARDSYERAIEARPSYAEAQNNLGVILQRQGDLDGASMRYRRALELRPDYSDAHSNLGTVYQERGAIEDAMACFDRALACDPNNVEARNNRTVALLNSSRVDEAFAEADQAAQAGPDHALARTNRAYSLLMQGDLSRGFAEMEWRLKTPSFPPRGFSQPRWDGRPLGGRTVLVCAEQGNGDTIQFARYLPMVRARGGRVLLECQPGLADLMRASGLVDEVLARRDDFAVEAPFDTYIEMMSLAALFGTTLDDMPDAGPYLRAPDDRVERWSQRVGDGEGLKVGLVWAGNPDHRSDSTRSVDASAFAPLAAASGVRFYSFQKGGPAAQLSSLAEMLPITDLAADLRDFADTAAALRCMDLVIAVDTSVAHLAGALGVPVWTLIARVPDWRWMLDREDTPWYPTMRLLRQGTAGDWTSVIARAAGELRELAASGQAPQVAAATAAAAKAARTCVSFGWPVGGPIGWGVVGLGMAVELIRRDDCDVVFAAPPNHAGLEDQPLARALLDEALRTGAGDIAECACLYPLGNRCAQAAPQLDPEARLRVGLPVIEDTALRNDDLAVLQGLDVLLTPTAWCRDVLLRAGLSNVRVLEQGVDPALFHPARQSPAFPGRFVVFSGGKLEYRKGQDIVVAAFREFVARHPEALLLTAWHNPWPQTLLGIETAGHVVGRPEIGPSRALLLTDWLEENGIPRTAVVDLGPMPYTAGPMALRGADVAVFPNRCEAATNLVAMEAMACGVPTVLSANTGHLDLVDEAHCYPLRQQGAVAPVPVFAGYDGWGESSVAELVEQLERVYADRAEAARRAERAVEYMQTRWWSRICEKLLKELAE